MVKHTQVGFLVEKTILRSAIGLSILGYSIGDHGSAACVVAGISHLEHQAWEIDPQ